MLSSKSSEDEAFERFMNGEVSFAMSDYDEPSGTCVVHGDYWTDRCERCSGYVPGCRGGPMTLQPDRSDYLGYLSKMPDIGKGYAQRRDDAHSAGVVHLEQARDCAIRGNWDLAAVCARSAAKYFERAAQQHEYGVMATRKSR